LDFFYSLFPDETKNTRRFGDIRENSKKKVWLKIIKVSVSELGQIWINFRTIHNISRNEAYLNQSRSVDIWFSIIISPPAAILDND